MKKKLLLFLPLLFIGLFFIANDKQAQAAVTRDDYYNEQLPSYPYRPDQTTSYQNRFLWSGNKIYTKVDYTTWIKDGYLGKTYYQDAHWDGGTYIDHQIARKFFGVDHFALKNLATGGTIALWDAPRMDAIYGEVFNNGTCPPTLYRRETGWIDIGGAVPNIPTGYFTRDAGNKKYFFNVSGTAGKLAQVKADFYFTSSAGNSYVDTGSGISSQAEDYVTKFFYIINDQPTSPAVTAYNSTASATGNIDVTPYFTSNKTWYIHIVAKSYTGHLSVQLNKPLRDASLMKTLTLSGDAGINTVTGAGSYYPGQTVNIDATLKPTGVKWKGWEGTGSPFTQAYSFTMPDVNISYKATTNKCSYVLELNGNGNTGGSMADIEVNYDTVLTIPKNAYERTNVPCKFIGWDLNRDSMTASYKDQQSLAIADLINFYKVGNTDARLPIYAIWDEAPNFIITQSPDRYFTLDEAKNGVITEAVLLSTVKAFDKETNPLQKKTKEDILSSGNDVGVTTYNYQASDFTDLNGKAKISMIYKVKDVAGSEGFLGINVFIVDNRPVAVSSNYRSIEGKYLYKGYLDNLKLPIAERKTADQLELLEPEFGGLKLSSYWRTNRSSLDKIYNQEIKQLAPERTIIIKKETMQRIKDDLLSKQVDYLDINRGTDFKYTKPIGEDYEILEYTKSLTAPTTPK